MKWIAELVATVTVAIAVIVSGCAVLGLPMPGHLSNPVLVGITAMHSRPVVAPATCTAMRFNGCAHLDTSGVTGSHQNVALDDDHRIVDLAS